MTVCGGFSLVELSIVLVILGLLVGGVLAGQSLIRASELRTLVTDSNNYKAAVNNFKDKYFALPGDITNATAFWGKDNASCTGNTGTAATPGTCNGDGDGLIEWSATAGTTAEAYRIWQQLALAGLISGSFSGNAGATTIFHHIYTGATQNAPLTRISGGGWATYNQANYGGDASWFAADYGNLLYAAFPTTGTTPQGRLLKPEEVWNIDTKIDDGKPGTGSVMVIYWDECSDAASNGSTTVSDRTGANYLLTETGNQCGIVFPKIY